MDVIIALTDESKNLIAFTVLSIVNTFNTFI